MVRRDTAEIWTLESTSGGWDHPMHIHFEEGQIISQNGVAVPLAQRHRYDIYRLRPEQDGCAAALPRLPAEGFTRQPAVEQTKADHGRYVMHCHNISTRTTP